jgi:hypothetical protein
MNGTILGRPINLVLGFVTAAINTAVLVGLVTLTAEQIAGLNTFAAALIALLASSDRIQIANGVAATARAEAKAAK